MADLIPVTISNITQVSSTESAASPKNLSVVNVIDNNNNKNNSSITAHDKLVFDTIVEVIRADGIKRVVAFQFYFRHYDGIQEVLENSDGKTTQMFFFVCLFF